MKYGKALMIGAGMASALQQYTTVYAQSKDPQRPNILWVIAEDMSYNDLGCYGNRDVRTPNIDRLARESVRYTNAATTGAVSSASRSGFITGMYQTAIGAHNHRTLDEDKKQLPEGVRPITHAIRDAGYLTVCCAPEKKGAAGKPNPEGSGKKDFNFLYDEATLFDAKSWREAKPGEPFFGYLTLLASHRGPWWREDEVRQGGIDPASITTIAPYYPDNVMVRNDYAAYYDAVEVVDRNVGQILERLRNEGILESTIVVFTSDHGRPMPRDKQFCWDEGIHVPLLIRYPDLRGAGTTDDRLVSSIDISAQMIRWSGGRIADYVQGRPFADAGTPERAYTVSARDRCDETVHRIRAVRTKEYLYIRNFDPETPYYAANRYKDTNYPTLFNMRKLYSMNALPEHCKPFFARRKPAEQLYDLRNDPHNLKNLADDPSMVPVLGTMRGYLDEWLSLYPDRGSVRESDEVMSRIMVERVKKYGF